MEKINKNRHEAEFEYPYPALSFYFSVKVGDFEGDDNRFQEVSGLTAERSVEEIIEGGVNDYKYRVPKQNTYGNLVLKRGLVTKDVGLGQWCRETIFSPLSSGNKIKPKDILIELLDPKDKNSPLMTWNVVRAYPIKWSVSNFNSQENAIVIETLEFAYLHFNIK